MGNTLGAARLGLRGISKTFDGVTVLRDFALELFPGEIHALLGQNGSGKSTLIKILAGYHTPDSGAVAWGDGQGITFPIGQADRHRLGLQFVHQDLGLVDELSVLDNLLVGRYRTGAMWNISHRSERRRVKSMLEEFSVRVDPDSLVGDIPHQADKALIAIVRAVQSIREQRGSGVLVLDEPTAYLSVNGIARLREEVIRLASTGVSVIYVTHRLEELAGFANRVSVLRDGRLVGTRDMDEASPASLVEMILGQQVPARMEHQKRALATAPRLRCEGLTGRFVRGASLEVSEGEIVGLTGLVGMGHEELPYLVYGAEPMLSGQVWVDQKPHAPDPRRSIQMGMVLIPVDRPRRALAIHEPAFVNLNVPVLSQRYFRRGALQRRAEMEGAADLMDRFLVTPRRPTELMSRLSGGNQQKVVLAKWLQLQPRIVLLDEPTHGIDVGAKAEVIRQIRALAAAGAAVLISSLEYEDLAYLCDRVIVFRDGVETVELSGPALTSGSIAANCFAA